MMGSTIGKQIKLTFVSEVRAGLRTENTSFETNGLYYIKDQATYICYDEEQDDSIVKNIIKIKDGEVLITRTGPVSMRQLFKKKITTTGIFKSPLATFQMETMTDNIEYHWNDKNFRGKLFISYSLRLNNDDASRRTITIKFKEETR